MHFFDLPNEIQIMVLEYINLNKDIIFDSNCRSDKKNKYKLVNDQIKISIKQKILIKLINKEFNQLIKNLGHLDKHLNN